MVTAPVRGEVSATWRCIGMGAMYPATHCSAITQSTKSLIAASTPGRRVLLLEGRALLDLEPPDPSETAPRPKSRQTVKRPLSRSHPAPLSRSCAGDPRRPVISNSGAYVLPA